MVGIIVLMAVIGLWLLVSALANWDWYKAIADFAVVETVFGENAGRLLCGLSGLILVGASIVTLVRHR